MPIENQQYPAFFKKKNLLKLSQILNKRWKSFKTAIISITGVNHQKNLEFISEICQKTCSPYVYVMIVFL